MGVFDNLGDWAGDFFTGDWKNAYEANPYLTAGIPALAATVATGGLAGPELLGSLGAVEGGTALAGADALAGAGAAEGAGSALGFAGGADAAGGSGLSSWFGTLGEGAMAGADAAGGALPFAGEAAGDSAGMIGLVGATPEAAGTGAADAAGSGGIWDSITGAAGKVGGALGDQLMKNPLGIGAATLGLGMNLAKGQKDSPELSALRNQAGVLNAQGQQLASYLQSGTLPPGLQASVKQAADAAKARIIANHAHNGMSTDPSQNSALAQELAAADQNAIVVTAQLGQQLLTTGINEVGLSEKIYEQLVSLDRAQSQRTGQAIAQFAAALNGGSYGMKKAA